MPGVLKLEGTNIATGDGNGAVTLGSAVTIGSNYQVPRKIYPFYHKAYTEGLGNNLTEVLSYQFGSAVQANAFYTLSCSIWCNWEAQTNSDATDTAIAAYIQNGDASKIYRFGYYKSNSGNDNIRLGGNASTISAGYFLSDSDGGIYVNNSWNGMYYTYSDVSGGNSTSELSAPGASGFSAGEALTLKVFMGSQNNMNYNISRDETSYGSRNFSFYCIKEYSALG